MSALRQLPGDHPLPRFSLRRLSGMLRHPLVLAVLFAGTAALAFQVARTLTQPAADDRALSELTPQGALLSIESPDFAGVLKAWNDSPQQKAWLASANYSVFSNSRLFGRLNDAETQYAAASRIPAATLLPQVAGKQSLFAWYNISNLEFLYITRMTPAQAAQTDLLKSRGQWQPRQSAGLTFYMRTSGNGADTPKRTVAFASVNGLFVLATREDLMASSLQLIAHRTDKTGVGSLAAEPWFTAASGTLKPAAGQAPILHMVLDLERIVPMPQFRSYWVQQNITEFKQYRASVADLYDEPNAFHEERSILLAAPEAGQVRDPDLAPLVAMAPPAGVFRAAASSSPDEAVTAIEEKLLGAPAPKAASDSAPDPSLSIPQAGSASDLDTRIDTLPPVSAAASNGPLGAVLKAAGFDSFLTWSSAQMPASSGSLWVPIHSAVILHGHAPWVATSVGPALQASLRGALTTSTLGIDFRPVPAAGNTVYALSGPKPLFFAVHGEYLLLADDQALLSSMLAPPTAASAIPSTLIAGFDHTAQRPPYARLTSLIDGTRKSEIIGAAPDAAPPAFFSGNMRSLSDAFAALASERITERHADSPSGPILRQTVVYQWQSK